MGSGKPRKRPNTKEANPSIGPRRTQVHFEVVYGGLGYSICVQRFLPVRYGGDRNTRTRLARAAALRFATHLRKMRKTSERYTIDVQTVTKYWRQAPR